MKAIGESFAGSGILVTQTKVSLQKSGLAGQLLKIKNQYECLVKRIKKGGKCEVYHERNSESNPRT